MPQLPPELITSFKKVIFEVSGRQLTDDEAQEYGRNLLETMAIVVRVRMDKARNAAHIKPLNSYRAKGTLDYPYQKG